jgi:hypothetical protein
MAWPNEETRANLCLEGRASRMVLPAAWASIRGGAMTKERGGQWTRVREGLEALGMRTL